jgi:hypothetical protein
MKKLALYSFILGLGLSCNSSQQTKSKETIPVKAENKEGNKIRFDFSAKRMNACKEAIEVNASLFNDGSDTVYFLTSTCEGDQYSLRYDTAKFVLTPFENCNASFPQVQKISPAEHYNFKAHFKCSPQETMIKLGFDFYEVEKSFDVKKIALINLHGRPRKDQNILWAVEKAI